MNTGPSLPNRPSLLAPSCQPGPCTAHVCDEEGGFSGPRSHSDPTPLSSTYAKVLLCHQAGIQAAAGPWRGGPGKKQ